MMQFRAHYSLRQEQADTIFQKPDLIRYPGVTAGCLCVPAGRCVEGA